MASLILLAALFGLSQLLLFIMDYTMPTDRIPNTFDKAVLSVQRLFFGEPDESAEAENSSEPQTVMAHSSGTSSGDSGAA